MDPAQTRQIAAVAAYRALHESGCFVLPNPWDVGTALYLQRLGFKALATTSAGMAFARGLADDVGAVPRDVMLAHVREVAEAVAVPVNADFQSGYAHDPEGVAANVRLCIKSGAAGLSIEDASGESASPLYELQLAAERVRAARRSIEDSGVPVVLTGRCEAWLVGHADPLRTALERLSAYAAAGADCLYAPGVTSLTDIAQIVREVAPKPVNVLVSSPKPDLTVERLRDLGVRRISVGSALSRVAWGAFIRASRSILETGTFDALAGGASFDELNALFRRVVP